MGYEIRHIRVETQPETIKVPDSTGDTGHVFSSKTGLPDLMPDPTPQSFTISLLSITHFFKNSRRGYFLIFKMHPPPKKKTTTHDTVLFSTVNLNTIFIFLIIVQFLRKLMSITKNRHTDYIIFSF